jgi:lactoylglutathione lyase
MKSKFKYVGIRVTNLQRSTDFYTSVLGLKVVERGENEQIKGKTVTLQSEEDGFFLELNYYDEDSPYNTKYSAGDGLDHLAFKVKDLEKALEEAKKAGHPTILTMKAGGGRWAYIEDPDGIWIELF